MDNKYNKIKDKINEFPNKFKFNNHVKLSNSNKQIKFNNPILLDNNKRSGHISAICSIMMNNVKINLK